MPNVKLNNYLHLHFIVFVWGFTAVIGKLITIDALPLVWYRMLMASLIILAYILIRKFQLRVPPKTLLMLILGGIVVSLHWVTFFMAIKVSNVSIALATMSTGAFFTALLEPFWYGRKMVGYEVVLGLIVMLGLYIMFRVETDFFIGILLALASSLLSATFSLINGKLTQEQRPSVISFYELGSGVLFLSVFLIYSGSYDHKFFQLSINDWLYIFILASVCTAYAFIASVKILKYISPYTVMLTNNLEPVYGILLGVVLLGDSEKMKPLFYLGALLVLLTVVANGILKNRNKLKKTTNGLPSH
ncbi:DMT family transporter [Arenibacter troitsensis]|uniref:Permease of the drug/metabolite transporter (DMT) superfamily n=1 Tax=Arenibacter troitsensis TaxID=188872 RepID=A0A1X7LDW3_9FLAO|nr:DMT family transporter [Arenibacter troitsensis]MDX1768106.1 DMT family transporter [Arenibacter troitsensis]SMG52038.1 Permease of the drug/metabolite transporter (DMT) superfamily [Arenibacter troitsensis]